MASSTAQLDEQALYATIRAHLAAVPVVTSVHLLPSEDALSVWIGIGDDESASYRAVYAVEDRIASSFPAVLFDFHIIPVLDGREMEHFVSEARPIFRRRAA